MCSPCPIALHPSQIALHPQPLTYGRLTYKPMTFKIVADLALRLRLWLRLPAARWLLLLLLLLLRLPASSSQH